MSAPLPQQPLGGQTFEGSVPSPQRQQKSAFPINSETARRRRGILQPAARRRLRGRAGRNRSTIRMPTRCGWRSRRRWTRPSWPRARSSSTFRESPTSAAWACACCCSRPNSCAPSTAGWRSLPCSRSSRKSSESPASITCWKYSRTCARRSDSCPRPRLRRTTRRAPLKRVRFWGTRGSLPVALTASAVRDKVIAALRAASGQTFASDDDSNAFVDGLGLPVSGTYGGHTSCVEIETGGAEYVLCDLGTGVRPFGQKALARHGPRRRRRITSSCPTCTGTTSWGFRFSRRRTFRATAYGSTAVTRNSRWRSVASRPRRRFRWISRTLAADIEFVRLQPGRQYDIAGMQVTPHAAAAFRRLLRIPLHVGRPHRHLHDRFRARAGGCEGDRASTSTSFAMPTW